MNFAEVASRYAARGWMTFPIWGLDGSVCRCSKGAGCHSPGKHPIGKGWQEASADASQLQLWQTLHPDCNIGIATGPSNLVVLDVDNVKVGEACVAAIKALIAEIPEIRDAWLVRTGSGAYHYVFKADPARPISISQGKIGPGLDIRANGGLIVAAPSLHASGGKYEWVASTTKHEMPVVPAALLDKIEAAAKHEASNPNFNADNEEPIPPGTRHSFFLTLAGKLRNLGFNGDEMLAQFRSVNARRCDPLHDDEDLCQIARDFENKEGNDLLNYIKTGQITPAPDANAGVKKLALVNYTEITEEPVEWLFPGYIALKKFGLLWGLEGSGKSYTTVGISADISNGRPLPGALPNMTKPGSVLLFAYEDDPSDTIKWRLRQCGANMSKVYCVNPEAGSFTYKDLDALTAAIVDIPDLQLVVLDPVLMFVPGINDNSEVEVRDAMSGILSLAQRKRFAVIGVKHANKREDTSWANRVSGSRGWTALPRTTFLAGHDNRKEQTENRTYGGMMQTKRNFGLAYPLGFEVSNGKFAWTGTDMTLTPETLFPKKEEKTK